MDVLRQYNLGGLKMTLNGRQFTNDEQVVINRKCLIMTCHEERFAVLVSNS
jgi:hypothetical protein